MMRSPCCGAEVRVNQYGALPFVTNYYACTACGQPCDPVEEEHDAECESEFDCQAHAHTQCGCASRRAGEKEGEK